MLISTLKKQGFHPRFPARRQTLAADSVGRRRSAGTGARQSLGPAARRAAGKGGVSMDFPWEKAGKWMEFPRDSRFFHDFPIGKMMKHGEFEEHFVSFLLAKIW